LGFSDTRKLGTVSLASNSRQAFNTLFHNDIMNVQNLINDWKYECGEFPYVPNWFPETLEKHSKYPQVDVNSTDRPEFT